MFDEKSMRQRWTFLSDYGPKRKSVEPNGSTKISSRKLNYYMAESASGKDDPNLAF